MQANPTPIYPYFLALIAAMLFACASVIFSQYSSKASSAWVVAFKNKIGMTGFALVTLVLALTQPESAFLPSRQSLLCFVSSGVLGLMIGDLFLFNAFQRIGSARTLMIFNFEPIMMSLGAYLLLGQTLTLNQVIALGFFMSCVFVISYERYRKEGTWELKGIVFAFIGVLLDCVGIIVTRIGFENSVGISPFAANFYRFLGGFMAFLVVSRFFAFRFFETLSNLTAREKRVITAASFAAGFMSLGLWLTAIQVGNLGSLSGIAAFSPIGSAAFEAILTRKLPSRSFVLAISLFAIGFLFLFFR